MSESGAQPPKRWALLTGSGRGLAAATAEGLAKDGIGLVLNARVEGKSLAAATQLKERLERDGAACELVVGDAATFAGGETVAQAALRQAGRVDIAVLAVGPWDRSHRPLRSIAGADVETILRGNLEGTLGALSVLLPAMRAQGFGRVITFGMDHIEAAPGWAGRGLYAAAKAALLSLMRTVAAEEAGSGITAHMVAPGNIRDPYKEGRIADARSDAVDGPRSGTGEDIARVVRFLCAEDSEFLTGSVIHVDGGEVVWEPGRPADL